MPVFAEVDANSQNITAESIRAVLTRRIRAVICVHLAGWPCDMDPIMALAAEKGLYVIEDCAQAHGASYKGRPVGSIGHLGAWSFCQGKIMTTGGEGRTAHHQPSGLLGAGLWAYKDHGKSWSAVYEREHPPGFRWLHDSFGINWRMFEMQTVIGRIQLRRMPEWHARRKANAEQLAAVFSVLPGLRMPLPPVDVEHAWYKFYAFIRPEALAPDWSRDRIMAEVKAAEVPCYSGSCPEVYLEKAFDGTGWRPTKRLPVAKALGETSLMFLVHPTLTDEEIAKTGKVLKEVMGEAS